MPQTIGYAIDFATAVIALLALLVALSQARSARRSAAATEKNANQGVEAAERSAAAAERQAGIARKQAEKSAESIEISRRQLIEQKLPRVVVSMQRRADSNCFVLQDPKMEVLREPGAPHPEIVPTEPRVLNAHERQQLEFYYVFSVVLYNEGQSVARVDDHANMPLRFYVGKSDSLGEASLPFRDSDGYHVLYPGQAAMLELRPRKSVRELIDHYYEISGSYQWLGACKLRVHPANDNFPILKFDLDFWAKPLDIRPGGDVCLSHVDHLDFFKNVYRIDELGNEIRIG